MHTRLKLLAGIVALGTVLALTACSGGDTDTGATEGAVDQNPEAAAAAEVVAAHLDAYTEFVAPGPALTGVEDLAGKTVYYIPATMQAATFSALADELTSILARLDIGLQVCDGKANPQNLATCLDQAVDAQAGAVIVSSLPREMATVAFQNVEDAGIPLLNLQLQPSGEGDPALVGYLSADNTEMHSWNANWVVADSNAEANVLVVRVTDSSATTGWIDQGAIPVYEECTACTFEVVDVNTGQMDKIPSLITTTLAANPDIDYVHVTFAAILQPTIQGIQAAGRDDIKVVLMDAELSVLQDLQAGRYIGAATGDDGSALSWYAVDEVLRMMTGQDSPDIAFPFRRMFTEANIGELELTPEAEASGAWFGGVDFESELLELWGVEG